MEKEKTQRTKEKKKKAPADKAAGSTPWQQLKPALRVVPEERVKELEDQIAAFAIDESRTEPMAFPASLPPHERKIVHRLAEEYNLSHESFGMGKERHIQVSKQPDVKERTLETLSISMKRRFVRDFELPIKCFDPEDFRYFLDLYDNEMHTHAKLNIMLEEIKSIGGEAAFHNFYFGMKEKIVQALTSSEAFQKFAQDEGYINSIRYKDGLPSSIYEPQNADKCYLSLDIRSANFNALRFYDPSILYGYREWEELLKSHFNITSPYILATKEFRSVIFHDTCPTKVSAINRWRMYNLHQFLLRERLLEKKDEAREEPATYKCYINTDELLIETETIDELRRLETAVEAAIQTEREKQKEGVEDPLLKALPDILRIQCFRLRSLPNPVQSFKYLDGRMFAKEIISFSSGSDSHSISSVEIKGVPPTHFAVAWKSYHGLEVTPKDLKYWNESADAYQHLVLKTSTS